MADCCEITTKNQQERRLLLTVLGLNGAMFFVEFAAGWLADSSGLIADSLDMLADAAVYAISFYAVGGALSKKVRAALVNGYLQLTLGILVLLDIVRRMLFGSMPEEVTMISIALLALAVNVTSFLLLYRHRQGDINMRASWICSRNDMLANVGVILAGILVTWLESAWPDWLIGGLIAAVVIHSALGIVREAKGKNTSPKSSGGCCS